MVTAGPEAVGVVPDATLLSRFTAANDEAAFAELVRRHGRLVWNVCRRRLARREDAEDAWQATFLAFAANAGSIRNSEALPGWLHRTACHAATRIASADSCGRLRDVPVHGLDAVAELARREAVVAVDEELVRLPRRYQSALVLFHLEGLERRQVAHRLGVSETGVKTLLRRGRTLLRSRLARRGFALPALLPFVADPVPAEAAAAVCGLAALGRAGLPPLGTAGPAAGPLAAAGSSLGAKSVAVALAGAVGVTLLLSSGGTGRAAHQVASRPAAVETILPNDPVGDTRATFAPAGVQVRLQRNRTAALHFTNAPLLDALDTVAAVHKLDLIVDEPALVEAGVLGPFVDDTVDLERGHVTLASVLDEILKPKGLVYAVRGTTLHVTTAGRAGNAADLAGAAAPVDSGVASRDERTTAASPRTEPGAVQKVGAEG